MQRKQLVFDLHQATFKNMGACITTTSIHSKLYTLWDDRGDKTKEDWVTELQSLLHIAHCHHSQVLLVPANPSYVYRDRDTATDEEALYSREYASPSGADQGKSADIRRRQLEREG
jgi:hypothetical protein